MTLSVLLSSKLIYNSMNAIDEQSLQQLNLVVNLTKHIQIRCSQPVDEFEDPDQLAKVFPSFLWLVRDFNLELVDQSGTPITPKEYLEMALLEQTGVSEKTEQKNRTRRLFKTLFTERDCLTFCRPIAEESKLQTLTEIPTEELSASFVKQLECLRKRVIGKMQAKRVHGMTINGPILVSLARQYVQAFNQGAVPNIESAWTYICRNEQVKALEKARQKFERILNDRIALPCSVFDLESDYKAAKSEALRVFQKQAISGEN